MSRRPLASRIAALASAALILQPGPGWAATIDGTAQRDVLLGTTAPDILDGMDGDDVLRGDPAGKDGATVSIRRISVAAPNAAGFEAQANGSSSSPAFSPDGEWVLFTSTADTIGPDANATADIFAKHLGTGAVVLVSSATPQNGVSAPGNAASETGVFSPDGNKVAFVSLATNLVTGVGNGQKQVYQKDLVNGQVTLISANAAGTPGAGASREPAFSPDGTRIAFSSDAQLIGGKDANGLSDIYVKTIATGAVSAASVTAPTQAGEVEFGNGASRAPAFAGNDRLVFQSAATNLGPMDANGVSDIYMKTLTAAGTVMRVSQGSPDGNGNEAEGDLESTQPAASPDGRHIAFLSKSTTFAGGQPFGSVFVKDTMTGALTVASSSSPGANGVEVKQDGITSAYAMAEDWSRMAFSADATNLGAATQAGFPLAFGKNLVSRETSHLSTIAGVPVPNAPVTEVAVSPDGSQIAFVSEASNLVPGDTNGVADIFVVTLGPTNGSADVLNGGAGNDRLAGGAGDDMLNGGDGNDALLGGSGNDVINGGAGADVAVYPGPRRRYKVSPVEGSNPAVFEVKDMLANAPEGTDIVSADVEVLRFTGTSGNVVLQTAAASNNQDPISAAVALKVQSGGEVLNVPIVVNDPDGDPLTVTVSTQPVAGTVDVAANGASFSYSSDENSTMALVTFTLTASDPWGGSVAIPVTVAVGVIKEALETGGPLDGGAGDDVLIGSAVSDTIQGMDGDDILDGGAGTDVLSGGAGNDLIDGGAGADQMNGGTGDDVYTVDDPKDVVIEAANEGIDTVEALVSYTLPNNVENLYVYSAKGLVGTGNVLSNVIVGDTGADNLKGMAGNDTISGGAGNDIIEGGLGTDKLDGGAGLDTLSFAGSTAAVTADLKLKTIGGDSVTGFENLLGSRFNDSLLGSDVANVINGGAGNDRIEGRKGKDTLIGGAGRNVFVFRSAADSPVNTPDTIADFKTGDIVDFKLFDANPKVAKVQRFTYVGAKKFKKKTPGQLRFSKGVLEGEITGDGKADFRVLLSKVTTLPSSALKLK